MGACPDWFAHLQAAKYLGVAPWELQEHSVWWMDKALVAMSAEDGALKIKQEHK